MEEYIWKERWGWVVSTKAIRNSVEWTVGRGGVQRSKNEAVTNMKEVVTNMKDVGTSKCSVSLANMS